MTRRERLENKLEKRQEWAEKAEQRFHDEMRKSESYVANIPFGQPILVGHHSEKAHRAAIDRAWRAADRSVAEKDLAKHHRDKAEGLSDYLENTIFDDDPDAIDRIQQRIDSLEKKHALMLAVNKICRNKKFDDSAKIAALVELGLTESAAKEAVHPSESWQSVGFDSYMLSNNSANIRRYKERLANLRVRQERMAAAENSENGVLIQERGYGSVSVTFAEKPEHSVISALKSAGFRWCKSSWYGRKEDLPAEVGKLMKGE